MKNDNKNIRKLVTVERNSTFREIYRQCFESNIDMCKVDTVKPYVHDGDIQHYQETDLEAISGDVRDFGPNLKYIDFIFEVAPMSMVQKI